MLALLWCFNWCMMGHPLAAEVVLCRHLQMIAPRMAVPKIPTHQWAATLGQSGQVWWVWPVVVEQRPILLAQMWQLFLTPEFGGKQGGSVIKTSSGNGKRGSVRLVFPRNIKKHPLLVARMITQFLERIYESIFLMLGGGWQFITIHNMTITISHVDTG